MIRVDPHDRLAARVLSLAVRTGRANLRDVPGVEGEAHRLCEALAQIARIRPGLQRMAPGGAANVPTPDPRDACPVVSGVTVLPTRVSQWLVDAHETEDAIALAIDRYRHSAQAPAPLAAPPATRSRRASPSVPPTPPATRQRRPGRVRRSDQRPRRSRASAKS